MDSRRGRIVRASKRHNKSESVKGDEEAQRHKDLLRTANAKFNARPPSEQISDFENYRNVSYHYDPEAARYGLDDLDA